MPSCVSKLFKTMGIDYDVFKEQLLKERARMQSDYKEDSDEDEGIDVYKRQISYHIRGKIISLFPVCGSMDSR